jgi:F-type H+-transporting ATPase subunit b
MKFRFFNVSAILFACLIQAGFAHALEEPHGAAHGGSSGGLPQFDPTWFASQIFWLAITFSVLYLWFSRKTLPEISGVIANRREHIQSDLDTADKLALEAEFVQNSYEHKLDQARTEARSILDGAGTVMTAKAAQAMESLRERTEREMAIAETRITAARSKAMTEINSVAAQAALDVAYKLAGLDITQDEALAAIDRTSGPENRAQR